MKRNRVAVILPCNLHWAPYYYRYEKELINRQTDFDLILWNRENINETSKGNIVQLKLKDDCNSGNPLKIWKCVRFADFVKRKLKIGVYNKIFILSTGGFTAALLSGYLAKKYKENYWLDIRDYSYEWFKPYYLRLKKCIENAYASSISSNAYKLFLPDHPYVIAHNMDTRLFEIRKSFKKSFCNRIRISYVGNIRYFKENMRILDTLKNDSRYILQYYGAGSDLIKEYCEMNGINNVDISGRFSPEFTGELYARTDIVNNVYGSGRIELDTALSNKLYYAAALHIPIIVSPGTYMEKITKEHGFGFSIDFNHSKWPDDLYEWYRSLDKDKTRYDDLWESFKNEDMLFSDEIGKYISR